MIENYLSGNNAGVIYFLEHVLGGQDFRAFILPFLLLLLRTREGNPYTYITAKKSKTRKKIVHLQTDVIDAL